MKKHLWMLAAIFICGLTVTSCVDEKDNPVDPPNVDPPSKSNISENSAFSSQIDMSTYAGDDFYQYAVGTWIKNNPVPTKDGDESVGTMAEQEELGALALAEITAYKKNQIAYDLLTSYSKLDLKDDSTALMKKLEAVDAVASKDDLINMMAELAKLGYTAPLTIKPMCMERKIYPALAYFKKFISKKDILKMGISSADAKALTETADKWIKAVEDLESGSKAKLSLGHHDPHAGMKLFNTARTRGAAGTAFINTFAKTLNMDLSVIAADEDYQKLLDTLLGYDLPTLKLLTKCGILNRDVKYIPFDNLNKANENDLTKILLKVVAACLDDNNGLLTSMSHSYVDTKMPKEAKAEVTAMFEEERAVFRTRIQNNNWMSDATKTKAIEKLDAMAFLCGWPENWHSEWEATMPTGDSFYAKVCNLFGQFTDITRQLIGQTSEDAQYYAEWMEGPAYMANAFYSPANNTIILLASNLIAPIYDTKQKDFYNYAILGATTIGHEMTHGFDSNGAKYDAAGKEKNWWDPTDLEKFKQKQQMMIDHFNKFEYMPGVYCDGTNTLGENIADLGGLEIAYETYMKKITATGSERDFLGREFFRAFAEGWKSNMTSEEMEVFKEDEHAYYKLRVNGNVCLTNEWYRLFNITSGDMYLAPDKRISIW